MIKMICGVYGHYVDGQVIARNKNSEPFEIAPEREAELVALGYAEYVDFVPSDMPIGFDEVPPDEGEAAEPSYSIDTSAKELREIGKEHGLSFKVGMSKSEMVAALDAHFGATAEEDDDGEDAPSFDASEAVL